MTDVDTTRLIIGDETQYFLDNAIIEVAQNLTRTTHSPAPVESNPLIQRDRPWEHVTYFSCNTWNLRRDDGGGSTASTRTSSWTASASSNRAVPPTAGRTRDCDSSTHAPTTA